MYNTGNAGFLAAACNPNRTVDTTVALSLSGKTVNLNTNDIVSYKITTASTAGKVFAPGSFVAGRMEMSLNAASDTMLGVNFKTATVDNLQVKAGIQVQSNMVYLPMGKFYPEEDGVVYSDDGHVTIKALDIPPVLYTQFNSSVLSLPCTVADALTKISTDTGISISVSATDFPNLKIQLIESFQLITTYREAIMYIAEVLGAYARMDRNSGIQLRRVFSGLVDIGCGLDENYLFSVNKHESSVKPFQYISIKANKDDLGVTRTVSGVATECTYDILNNPLTYGHPEDFLDGLVAPTTFQEFYPAKLSFQGRPDLDVGDVLRYTHKDVTYVLPICSHVFEYNGGFITTVESIGSDTKKTSSVDAGLKEQVSALKQNINSFVRDLESTKSQITSINGEVTKISSLSQTADKLLSQISVLEGDIEKLSTLTQTANGLRLDIESVVKDLATTKDTLNDNQKKLLTYFDFQADGLTIGLSSSNIKLRLANNKVQFLKNDTVEVAYFSEGQLYVTDAHFLNSLVLGNFELTPRSNGNLSLRRRG